MRRPSDDHHACLTEPRFLILLSLVPKPRHGYGIIKDVHSLGNSKVRLTTGTLYGGLRELTEMGWLEVVPAEPTRGARRPTKAYSLTLEGREALLRQIARMRWLLAAAEKQGL
jgi:PadR family transcriptional regulator, regulatory protein PadR